jgi:anthranilate phosphoribosyltransferase
MPVILPSYNGAIRQPNLLPLLALLLQRLGMPVLVHGTLNGDSGVASAYIFRELGIMPCASLAQAQDAIDNQGIAFVPTAVLSPGLADLLSTRARLGVRSSAHIIAKLMDPFVNGGLRVVSAADAHYLDALRQFLMASGARALLLQSTEGEPYANPRRRPQIEYFAEGAVRVLFEAESVPLDHIPNLPTATDAKTTAIWIRQALAGGVSVPLPIIHQLACLLYATGYSSDMNQAKAVVAVETGNLAAV